MESKIRTLIAQYRADAKQAVVDADYIVSKIGDDTRLVQHIYNSAVMAICIKYESFTSEAHQIVFGGEIAFNKPWQYTRDLYKFFQVQNFKEYEQAKDIWFYYNSLKHSNDTMKARLKELKKEYSSFTPKQVVVHTSDVIDGIFARIEKNLHNRGL